MSEKKWKPGDRDDLINIHSDVWKEIHGVRPRRDWGDATEDEVHAEIEDLVEETKAEEPTEGPGWKLEKE